MMEDQGSQAQNRRWSVPEEQAGRRLENFAGQILPQLSRRQLRRAIAEQRFMVNGRPARKGHRLAENDLVEFAGPDVLLSPGPPPNDAIQISIVYEDAQLLVLDKPAGVDTHGFSGRDRNTLANFIAARRPEVLGIGKNRWQPGMVQRLDRETSGLVIVAKTQAAFEKLRAAFRSRKINKKYWAMVWGKTTGSGVISYPLAHDRSDARRMVAVHPEAHLSVRQKTWEAVTRYRTLAVVEEASLLEIEMQTGVMHQIRAHLAAIGHPILGDEVYGDLGGGRFGLRRHFLHAFSLELWHPQSGRRLTVRSPLPAELEAVLVRFRMKI